MFVVFKAWAEFNIKRIFSSLELAYLYLYLEAKLLENSESVTFLGLMQ
jgi:hypothetical protein